MPNIKLTTSFFPMVSLKRVLPSGVTTSTLTLPLSISADRDWETKMWLILY